MFSGLVRISEFIVLTLYENFFFIVHFYFSRLPAGVVGILKTWPEPFSSSFETTIFVLWICDPFDGKMNTFPLGRWFS